MYFNRVMQKTIRFKNHSATISNLGAELISLAKDNENILWNRDPEYWADSALILFPFIGRNYNDTYLYNNKEYNIGLHGFASKKEFNVVDEKTDSITLKLQQDEETLKVYPFNFVFTVRYYFEDSSLKVEFNIKNNSPEVMPFTCGYHPGFMLKDKLDTYKISFPFANNPEEIGIVSKCMLNNDNRPLCLNENSLELNKDLFVNSARVFKGLGDTAVLIDKDGKENVKLKFEGYDYIVLWQTLNSDADFICIEGWRGLPGTFGHIDDIKLVKDKTFLDAGKEISYLTTITY